MGIKPWYVLTESELALIESKLDSFYADNSNYYTAAIEGDRTPWRNILASLIPRLIASYQRSDEPFRILEIGCGKSDYPTIAKQFELVEYHCHDINDANRGYLENVADVVHTGQVEELTGQYDLIFSTFVFEHVLRPEQFLSKIKSLLVPNGVHLIICPVYDFLPYVCPSVRKMGPSILFQYFFKIAFYRALAVMSGRPYFLINDAPAVFSGRWFRDCDALHIVLTANIYNWHLRNGFKSYCALDISRVADMHWLHKKIIGVFVFQKEVS